MNKFCTVLFVLFLMSFSVLQAEKKIYRGTGDYIVVDNEDTLIVAANKLWVFSESGYNKFMAQKLKSDSLNTLYKMHRSLSDSLFLLQDSLTFRLNNVIALQKTGYDSLTTLFNRTAFLVDKSTANTDRALSHMKHLKLMSYASGAFLGGISGGLVGGQIVSDDKFQFSTVGAISGAVLGFALNRFLLNLR